MGGFDELIESEDYDRADHDDQPDHDRHEVVFHNGLLRPWFVKFLESLVRVIGSRSLAE